VKFNYPQHLLLDVQSNNLNYSNKYWVLQYSKSFAKDQYFSTTLNFINNTPKYTLKNGLTTTTSTVKFTNAQSFFRTKALSDAKHTFMKNKSILNSSSSEFTPLNLYKHSTSDDSSKLNHLMSSSLTHLLFDINFIKKERLYTKLKYSRSPAYDIVSGGAAALLSAFIGFLISEKFGIELVDSGDFYIGFMYVVFIALACRPLLRILDVHKLSWSIFSPNHAFDFFQTLFYFFTKTITSYLTSFVNLFSNIWTKPSTLNVILIILVCLLW